MIKSGVFFEILIFGDFCGVKLLLIGVYFGKFFGNKEYIYCFVFDVVLFDIEIKCMIYFCFFLIFYF